MSKSLRSSNWYYFINKTENGEGRLRRDMMFNFECMEAEVPVITV